MADVTRALAREFSFSKDEKFLDNQVGAKITVSASGAAAEAIAQNQPFGPGTTQIGSLSASVHGNPAPLKFGGAGQGAVTFSASAGVSSTLAVYGSMTDLVTGLNCGNVLEGLTLDGGAATQFFLLDWNYDMSASAHGAIALSAAGSATFAVDGGSNGLFAVIRGFATPPKAGDAVAATIGSWELPLQVTSADDLAPGTWLVAEVDGSICVKLGAQYGYNFNWIRNVSLGGLSGDIGLKIQAAVDAAIGFNASGKYLVVVARESLDAASKVVRVQVFKMAKKGWTFAFNASVGVTGSTGSLLPAQLDCFLAAVFGVHGPQLVEDLKLFDKWTDPNTPLPDLFAGYVSDFATKELRKFAGTEIQKFEEARRQIAGFLQQWNSLGHTVSTMLWSSIQKAGGPVAELLDFLRKTDGLSDAGLRQLIAGELSKTGFASNPIGQWLEAVAEKDVLSLLDSDPLLAKVRTAAQTVLSIANGQALDHLVRFVGEKLDISKVEQIVNQADFNNLDPWMKEKLAKFLGRQTVLFADLDKIRAAARTIRDKAADLYSQAVRALNNTYTAELHYTYAKTTTSTALVDVSIDFTKDTQAGSFLKMAIRGDFKDLLLAASPALALNSATLTHGVRRQSHIQIALPYFRETIDTINNSLASLTISEDGGRLFALQATDTKTVEHRWASQLTVTGKLPATRGTRVFVTDQDLAASMTFAYSFRQASKAVRDVQLQNQLQPLVAPYFANAFGTTSLQDWIGTLDAAASKVSGGAGAPTGDLGTVLLSLDVSLPGQTVAAWLNAPANNKAPVYLQMSRNIQHALRRYTQFSFFNDPAAYTNIDSAAAVYVYGCLPISTKARLDEEGVLRIDLPDDIYWNYPDPNLLKAMAFSSIAQNALLARMSGIHAVLSDSPSLQNRAQFYTPDQAIGRTQTALRDPKLRGLLFTEAQTIRHAIDAAVSLANFRDNSAADPEAAIQALEDFGARITDAFNKGLGSLAGPTLQEFSAMIFLEAARSFDPTLAGIQPTARLDTILLRPSTSQDVVHAFLSGTAPDPSNVALEQPVVGWNS